MDIARGRNSSSLVTAVGIVVALIAIVGTQFLGWEWVDGRLVPTILGVAAAVVAVAVLLRRRG